METVSRKSFEGVGNIIRFNWHFYVLVGAMITALLVVKHMVPAGFQLLIFIAVWIIIAVMVISLAVSYYVYDVSNLYSLEWLNFSLPTDSLVVSINAGFDEISPTLAAKYPLTRLQTLDFYDPQKHTEVSIRRARKAKPPYPGTRVVATNNLGLENGSVGLAVCFLSAHEIREAAERMQFFQQLQQALKPAGKIVVVEHLRDTPNFLAYNIGAFHFHSKKSWEQAFLAAGLQVEDTRKITPLITAFTLCKHGTAP